MRPLLTALLSLCLAFALAGCRRASEQAANNAEGANASGETSPAAQSEAQRYVAQGNDAFYKNDQEQEAIEAYKKAIELDPNYGEAYYRLGLVYVAGGKRDEAEEAFKKAIEVLEKQLRTNQKDAQVHYILGQSLMGLANLQDTSKSQKTLQEAVKALKKAVSLEPENADMYYELGQAHSRLIQYREAVAAFEKATELDPDNYRASEALEKAKEDLSRFNTLYKREETKLKQEEAARKRKEEEENANGNANANSNNKSNDNSSAPKAP